MSLLLFCSDGKKKRERKNICIFRKLICITFAAERALAPVQARNIPRAQNPAVVLVPPEVGAVPEDLARRNTSRAREPSQNRVRLTFRAESSLGSEG